MFLSGDSLGVNIISSKSSEMNVMIPGAEEFVEVAVPEQFRTQLLVHLYKPHLWIEINLEKLCSERKS